MTSGPKTLWVVVMVGVVALAAGVLFIRFRPLKVTKLPHEGPVGGEVVSMSDLFADPPKYYGTWVRTKGSVVEKYEYLRLHESRIAEAPGRSIRLSPATDAVNSSADAAEVRGLFVPDPEERNRPGTAVIWHARSSFSTVSVRYSVSVKDSSYVWAFSACDASAARVVVHRVYIYRVVDGRLTPLPVWCQAFDVDAAEWVQGDRLELGKGAPCTLPAGDYEITTSAAGDGSQAFRITPDGGLTLLGTTCP